MSLLSRLQIIISSTISQETGLSKETAQISETISNALDAVTTDVLFTATGTIAGGSDDIDLSGSLADPLGNAAVFAKVMAVFIRNNGSNAMTVGGTNNIPLLSGSTDKINLAADACFMIVDENGIAVTAATADLITIAGTNGDTYDIVVIGSST